MRRSNDKILHCDCGIIYILRDHRSSRPPCCPACGQVPRVEELKSSGETGSIQQQVSPVFKKCALPSAIIIGVIGLAIALPKLSTPQTQLPSFSSPAKTLAVATPRPTLKASPTRPPVSLPNGTNVIPPLSLEGRSHLTVDNGTSQDAVIKLVDQGSNKVVRFVYVRAHQKAVIQQITPCACVLKFSTGVDWDKKTQTFLRSPAYAKFANPINFEEIFADDGGVKWQNYTVTLHPIPASNARTQRIREQEFN